MNVGVLIVENIYKVVFNKNIYIFPSKLVKFIKKLYFCYL